VLVVRSGVNPFASAGQGERVEIIEKVSHTIEPVEPPKAAFDDAFDLTVFTSQIAVERLRADPRRLEAFRRATMNGRVAAVGEATAEALLRQEIRVDVTARGSAESVLELLPMQLDGWRALLPCGQDAAGDLPEGLLHRGAQVTRAVLYRKVALTRDPLLAAEIVERPFAAFCATSPVAARWLFEGLPEAAAQRLRQTPAVVLGRFTRRFLESHGVERIAVTEEQRFAAAVKLLEELATAPAGA
jgi:uroporphyrinogen III methyltransferase/synthase